MEKTESINLRVDPRLKEQLVKAAKQEQRSVSNYVVKVLSDKLKQSDTTFVMVK
jgi:predicted HicB family RNase H-like nuclease